MCTNNVKSCSSLFIWMMMNISTITIRCNEIITNIYQHNGHWQCFFHWLCVNVSSKIKSAQFDHVVLVWQTTWLKNLCKQIWTSMYDMIIQVLLTYYYYYNSTIGIIVVSDGVVMDVNKGQAIELMVCWSADADLHRWSRSGTNTIGN